MTQTKPCGRYHKRICDDARKKFTDFRERNNIHPLAPFAHKKPLWEEAYEEALDAVNYGAAGRHDGIVAKAYALAEECLDVGDPGWRERV